MSRALSKAGARVLQVLREGAELTRHTRAERGPYYLMQGRRLSMPLVKQLEEQRFIAHVHSRASTTTSYTLTPAGREALEAWERA
jgi:DNA-binding PadR family transcriptional regulator